MCQVFTLLPFLYFQAAYGCIALPMTLSFVFN